MITTLKRKMLRNRETLVRTDVAGPVQPDGLDEVLPSLSLLDSPTGPSSIDSTESDALADKIGSQFTQRGIDATYVGVDIATRMLTFRFRIAEGVYDQVTKADDLLRRMISMVTETSGVSIQAPIPNSLDIGVQLPRKGMIEPVRLAPFVETARRLNYRVPLSLGEDHLGRPKVVDLATECHQLVAGQTGSGKSVFLSSAVLTIALATTPETVRLVLVDGKGLDLTAFDPLPHNACPVITEPSEAARALGWLNGEMDRRRQTIRQEGLRDVWALNDHLAEQGATLPALVLIVDEFQTILSEPDADQLLQRLAQQGRACGIFVVLATQRPSVDVLQGSTKTNVPGRVCFRLPSQVDSRVVLDQGGAEQLAQPGDLLAVQSSIGLPVRLQCPLPSLDETQRVSEFFANDRPAYLPDLIEAINSTGSSHMGVLLTNHPSDVLSSSVPDEELARPSMFLPVCLDEKTVLRKLTKDFPSWEWSVELTYRPMLWAEMDGKENLLYDLASRSLITHLAPWCAVSVGDLFDLGDEEFRLLASLRHMPRDLRGASDIASWLTERGHATPPLIELVMQGILGSDYRMIDAFNTVPSIRNKLATSALPNDVGQVLAVAESTQIDATQGLRKALAMLWECTVTAAGLVGLPIYATRGSEQTLQFPAARAWPWRSRASDMTTGC